MRIAPFLHVAGSDAIEKYNSFQWETEADKNDPQESYRKIRK